MSVRKVFLITVFFWVGGCCLFIMLCIFSYKHDHNACFDNIVVLTGGRDRIACAFSLAESCKPKNIFISGVYKGTMLHDILPEKPIRDVNIILGKQAKNTEQNAKEIDEWVKENDISEILLITSDYHMMRSMAELRRVNDRLKIYPCAVNSSVNFVFFLICVKEFHKMIYIQCRNLLGTIKNTCCF